MVYLGTKRTLYTSGLGFFFQIWRVLIWRENQTCQTQQPECAGTSTEILPIKT